MSQITTENNYTADNIKVLEGLEAVRVRPAMYIGSTGSMGLHHLVYEVVDNSIDEAMAGYCTKIKVFIHFDNSITVIDNGRGIPVDFHKEEGKSAAEVVMTTLHAGGKFDSDTYKVSGGLHGVGVSCVNALSSKLELEIKKEGFVYFQKYEIGNSVTELKKVGTTTKRGTKITFWPDEDIFEVTEYDFKILSKRLKELAFLNAGVEITITDERTNLVEKFHYEGGISEYVDYLCSNKEKIHDGPIVLKTSKKDAEVEIALQYINSYNENLLSFVNNINTIEGGTHLTGFKGAITRTINSFAHSNNVLKKDLNSNLSGEDVREGLVAVISVRLIDPQFEGQTKGKLGNSEVKGVVESFVNEKLYEFFEENIGVAKQIINKAALAAQAREASRKAKDLIRKTSLLESTTLPGKLADCQSKNPEESEIYIVEGDSAGGSAKQGRDRKFQAILPLKGKILNVEKATTSKMLESGEIKTMIAALGVGIGKDNFDIEKLRYHKIIIMTDADVDGSHIRTLIMTFFFRHMKEIIERGYLYLAQPPLFLIKKGKKSIYLKNEKELENHLLEKIGEDIVLGQEDTDFSLSGDELIKFVKLISKKEKLIKNIEKRGIPVELTQLFIDLIKDENTFKDREQVEKIAEIVEKLDICRSVVIDYDEEYSMYYIRIAYDYKGVRMNQLINWDYFMGPLFAEINEVYEKLRSYPSESFIMISGNEKKKIHSSDNIIEALFDSVKKGTYIQRYKGLGEMNPPQLWETTMDPSNRTLLKVNINDLMESETIFEVLMGSDSHRRKDFIIDNALNVKNLDI